MPPENTADRLPTPPPEVLDLLRRVEANLEEAESLRRQVTALRAALEAEPEPRADHVAAAMFTGEGTLSFGTVDDVSGTAAARSGASGSADVIPSGGGSGSIVWTGNAEGHAPTVEETARVRHWAGSVGRHGPTLFRVADLILRLWDRFDPTS